MENQLKQFYYEFNEHDYYALIAVYVEEDDLQTKPHKKATEIYAEVVAGESVEEILEEAEPNQRTKEYAFMKFAYGINEATPTIDELIKDFEGTKNGVLLIDGSLI